MTMTSATANQVMASGSFQEPRLTVASGTAEYAATEAAAVIGAVAEYYRRNDGTG